MAKILDPQHDLPFKLNNQVGLTHSQQREGVSCAHSATQKKLYQQKLDALADAVIRNATIEEIENIQEQIRQFKGIKKGVEKDIEQIMWRARREFQGMTPGY